VREQRHSSQVHFIHQKQALNLNEPVHIKPERKQQRDFSCHVTTVLGVLQQIDSRRDSTDE